MRHYISKETALKIRQLYKNVPKENQIGITHWTILEHGVKFDGGWTSNYYLEGPDEKITWFLLQL